MKKKIILSILIGLTIMAALISNIAGPYATLGVIGLGAFKFIGVAFYFMDMRKAHVFWKFALGIFLVFFVLATVITIK